MCRTDSNVRGLTSGRTTWSQGGRRLSNEGAALKRASVLMAELTVAVGDFMGCFEPELMSKALTFMPCDDRGELWRRAGVWTDKNDQFTLFSAMIHREGVTVAQVQVPADTKRSHRSKPCCVASVSLALGRSNWNSLVSWLFTEYRNDFLILYRPSRPAWVNGKVYRLGNHPSLVVTRRTVAVYT
jgi:hypothetical protein